MIEKLRLKNATLKTHIKKVEVQLKHKEEMGDVLHYIDFHQLQIENKQVRPRGGGRAHAAVPCDVEPHALTPVHEPVHCQDRRA